MPPESHYLRPPEWLSRLAPASKDLLEMPTYSNIAACGNQPAKSLSVNWRGLAHLVVPWEQNVPVPLSSADSRIGSESFPQAIQRTIRGVALGSRLGEKATVKEQPCND